jgi:2-methylcitrate dehydratase PrpD
MSSPAENRSEIVRRLARYLIGAREQDIPDEARQAACRCVLDLVAAAAVGIAAPGLIAMRRTALATLAPGAHPIWFTAMRTNLIGAIWCNSATAAALDLDDGHRLARGHPGAAVIPAAFAGAQEVGASTEDLLKAIVIGYEVAVSVGAARRFYANTGLWSGYGVVAALGYLRGTGVDALAHAFAISGVSAPNQLYAGTGPTYPAMTGSDTKEGIPWSSLTAANALYLAEAGQTGPLALLDVEDHFDTHRLIEDLGRRFHVTQSYFKFLACCRHVHAPVEALLVLIEQHGLLSQEIDSIEVETYSGALRLDNRPEPISFTDIQFSIPYCLGLVAFGGRQALLPVPADALGRPEIIKLARKVSLRLDAELDRRFPAETLCRVSVRVGDRNFVSPVMAPRGEANASPSWSELEEKLRIASRLVATPAQQDTLVAAARRLQDADHRPLVRAFADLRLGHSAVDSWAGLQDRTS